MHLNEYREADGACACRCQSNCCLVWITGVLAALTLFAGGILLGANIAATVLEALPAFIVLIAVLAVITLAFFVLTLCRRGRCCC